jgi:hypothetical protein
MYPSQTIKPRNENKIIAYLGSGTKAAAVPYMGYATAVPTPVIVCKRYISSSVLASCCIFIFNSLRCCSYSSRCFSSHWVSSRSCPCSSSTTSSFFLLMNTHFSAPYYKIWIRSSELKFDIRWLVTPDSYSKSTVRLHASVQTVATLCFTVASD